MADDDTPGGQPLLPAPFHISSDSTNYVEEASYPSIVASNDVFFVRLSQDFSQAFLILDVYIMNNNPKRFLLRILTRTVDEHLASRHLAFFALNFYCMALEQRRSTESTRFESWKSAGPQALLPCYMMNNDEGPHFSL